LQENKKIKYFYHSKELLPNKSGKISTPITTLISSFEHIHMLNHYSLIAESIRAQPQLVTASVKTDRSFEETALMDDALTEEEFSFFQKEQQTKKTETEVLTLKLQQSLTEELNKNGRSFQTQDNTTGAILNTNTPGFERNTFHLGENRVTCGNVPTPQVRNDLVDLYRSHEDNICAAFGVPRSIVMSERSQATSAATDTTMQIFQQTIKSYLKEVERVLNETYEIIYKSKDGRIVLPGVSFLNSQIISNLYDRGVISKKTEATYLLKISGIHEDELQSDEFYLEQDKLFLQQKKNEVELPQENLKLQKKQHQQQHQQQQHQQQQQQHQQKAELGQPSLHKNTLQQNETKQESKAKKARIK
jgi:hypothetical protein